MKTLTLSRGPEVDMDKCTANIGSRYDMIILAAARAREIRRLNRSSDRREHVFTAITALKEIEAGKIGMEYKAQKLAMQKARTVALPLTQR